MDRTQLLTPHLQPDEDLIWSEIISEDTLANADHRTPVRTVGLAIISCLFGLWFTVWGLMKAQELLADEDYLLLSFGAPIVIILALVFLWYAYISTRPLFLAPLIERVPTAYAITSQRLLAVLASGDLADELAINDMGEIADLDSDNELLIRRKDSSHSGDDFYMMLIEDVEGARAAIEKLSAT